MNRKAVIFLVFFTIGLISALALFSFEEHTSPEVNLRDAMQHRLQDMLRMKQSFEEGKIPSPDPKIIHFAGLGHSEAVKEVVSYQDHFMSFDQFYADLNGYSIQQRQEAIAHYNTIVRSCESCHQTVCPGPLRSIKRLKINVENDIN